MKRKVLWVGDAVIESGFSKCTHNVLKHLLEQWEINVLGINYNGDPHHLPYPVYPCTVPNHPHPFGIDRLAGMINALAPDVIFVQNDPWNIPKYFKPAGNCPIVASMAVDGKNCRGNWINGLKMGIFWTDFALKEARNGGYSGPSRVIPLGVDREIFHPMPKIQCRHDMSLPERLDDAFIVGNVNRNQPRKRLDLSVQYFAEWVKEFDVRDAYLFLHLCPTGENEYDVKQLMEYYGLANRLIITQPDIGFGVHPTTLVKTFSCFDTQINTGQGEGWGLTAMEGMACGVPQIAGDWSALGEWAKDAAHLVLCTTIAVTPNKINVIGGIPDKSMFIFALQEMYSKPELREKYIERGFELVGNPAYRWENIALEIADAVETALGVTKIG
jgi:glycosyltransferase involved in cell wall biosynthesis